MSILSRYTAKEVLAHVAGVLAVVLSVFLVRRLGMLLDDAAGGSVPLGVVFSLLGLRTVIALPSMLPVVLYLAVLLALGRLYRDGEMTALATSGIAPVRMRLTILGLASIAALVVGGLAFSVRPWAATRYEYLKRRAQSGLDLGSMMPGRFYGLNGAAERVVFSEGRAAGDRRVMEHVFVQERHQGRLSVSTAERAVEHHDERSGQRILRLLDGHRYDTDSDGRDWQVTRYKELVIRTAFRGPMIDAEAGRTRATPALARSREPRDVAELQWRLAMPVSTVLLMMLAVPLARIDPRGGKYARVLLAVLLYVIYRHVLGVAKSWVGEGTLAPLPGTWAVHAGCLALVAFFFLREISPWRRPVRGS